MCFNFNLFGFFLREGRACFCAFPLFSEQHERACLCQACGPHELIDEPITIVVVVVETANWLA